MPAILESSNPSIATTLETRALQDLPTPARNVFFLSVATPSVVPTGDPQFVRQQDQTNSSLLSLGGGPRRANNYTIDGVSITDLRNRPVFIPNIESVHEVRVQVSTYDAEMGRTGGGVFNASARSGGNDWHGSGVFQNRPSFASSQLYFARKANTPKPETYYYLYGGSFGGPIKEDRTFFWASTENYKTLTSRNAVLILPTARELTGDFSQSGVTIYDPLTTRANPAGLTARELESARLLLRDEMRLGDRVGPASLDARSLVDVVDWRRTTPRSSGPMRTSPVSSPPAKAISSNVFQRFMVSAA